MTSFGSPRQNQSYQLLNPSFREHVMLLCNDQKECASAAVDSINEGLQAGQLCIYASVLNGDKLHLEEISSKITNYSENIEKGNLVIVDFLPFYERSEEHTSELQSRQYLVCRLLLEKKKTVTNQYIL